MNHDEIYEVYKKFNAEERERLRKLAEKITKVPKFIRYEVDYV